MTSTLHRGKGLHDPVYVEIDGEKWRVHDVRFENGKYKTTPIPSSRATGRVFVNEKGLRRHHKFTSGENRQLTASILEAQLRRATYLGSLTKGNNEPAGPFGGSPPSGR